MTTTTPTAALPSAGGERPRNLLSMGVALTCAGATMLFGALLAAYIELRSQTNEWVPEEVELDNYLGNMLVITLLLASITIAWSVSAVKRGETRQATAALAIAVGFGLAFINLLSYTAGRTHVSPGDSAYGAVVAALAIALGIVVCVAIGLALLTLFRVRGSQVGPDNPDQARATAWLWYYATLASIIVWFAVIVRK